MTYTINTQLETLNGHLEDIDDELKAIKADLDGESEEE